MKTLFIGLFAFMTVFAVQASYTVDNLPNPKTYNAGNYVSDPDNILQEQTRMQINVLLDSLEKQTNSEVAVVVVQSIGETDINSFATDLFTKWGIGKKDQNNGLLLLMVMDQKKTRFETGYGLEGVFPDAISKRIQSQTMLPYFRTGDFDNGILQGVRHVCAVLKQEPFEAQPKNKIDWGAAIPYALAVYLLLSLISILWINQSIAKVKKDTTLPNNIARYKMLKSEKNGILVLIAIGLPIISLVLILMFGNPLYIVFLLPVPLTVLPANIMARIAMWRIRKAPIACPECNGKMHILSEKKEDAFLSLSQQFEEQLHAVDYDVFVCDDCKNEAIFMLDKPSAYSECPKCKTKAFILVQKKVVVEPSFVNTGVERSTYKCKFCGHEENNNTNIPRISRTGAVAGGIAAGTLFSGRGGFGGGGFSGGGDFGGSFGGGMSGGGGSTSGW